MPWGENLACSWNCNLSWFCCCCCYWRWVLIKMNSWQSKSKSSVTATPKQSFCLCVCVCACECVCVCECVWVCVCMCESRVRLTITTIKYFGNWYAQAWVSDWKMLNKLPNLCCREVKVIRTLHSNKSPLSNFRFFEHSDFLCAPRRLNFLWRKLKAKEKKLVARSMGLDAI